MPLWELALQAIWAQTLTTLLLKLQTNPLDQISTPLLWNIWSVASYQFVLSQFLTPTTRTLPHLGQHCSTLLIIKILLMPLTGPDNPLLRHYFCYYLKWVYDNEMFTTGDTLTCSYGGLGEEISDIHSVRAVSG